MVKRAWEKGICARRAGGVCAGATFAFVTSALAFARSAAGDTGGGSASLISRAISAAHGSSPFGTASSSASVRGCIGVGANGIFDDRVSSTVVAKPESVCRLTPAASPPSSTI